MGKQEASLFGGYEVIYSRIFGSVIEWKGSCSYVPWTIFTGLPISTMVMIFRIFLLPEKLIVDKGPTSSIGVITDKSTSKIYRNVPKSAYSKRKARRNRIN